MPQNSPFLPAVQNGVSKPLNLDNTGALIVADNQGGELASYNITTATVVKVGAGYVGKISVVVAGSAAGAIYDAATTGSVAASNEISTVPTTGTVIALDWPVATGIVVAPGTGQTLAITYR